MPRARNMPRCGNIDLRIRPGFIWTPWRCAAGGRFRHGAHCVAYPTWDSSASGALAAASRVDWGTLHVHSGCDASVYNDNHSHIW